MCQKRERLKRTKLFKALMKTRFRCMISQIVTKMLKIVIILLKNLKDDEEQISI